MTILQSIIIFNTICMYIMYKVNISTSIDELILFFLSFIQCLYIMDILMSVLVFDEWRLD